MKRDANACCRGSNHRGWMCRERLQLLFFLKVRPYRTAERDVSKLDPLSGFTERQEIPMSVM